MTSKAIKCFRCVDGKNLMVKNGKTKIRKSTGYSCKICHKTKVATYIYKAWNQDVNQKIILFTKEGLGIRSTARLLKISTTTLLKKNYNNC